MRTSVVEWAGEELVHDVQFGEFRFEPVEFVHDRVEFVVAGVVGSPVGVFGSERCSTVIAVVQVIGARIPGPNRRRQFGEDAISATRYRGCFGPSWAARVNGVVIVRVRTRRAPA